MKLPSSFSCLVSTGLLLSGRSLVKGDYLDVTSVWDEGDGESSVAVWEWRG